MIFLFATGLSKNETLAAPSSTNTYFTPIHGPPRPCILRRSRNRTVSPYLRPGRSAENIEALALLSLRERAS
jgi:hypothetical protein